MKKIFCLFISGMVIISSIGCNNNINNIQEKTNETSTISGTDTSESKTDKQSTNDKNKDLKNDSNVSDASDDTESSNMKTDSKLGDNLFNKSFEIDNVVHTLPCKIDDFLQIGCTINNEDKTSEVLPPNFTNLIVLKKDRSYVFLYVENQTNNKLVSSECPITGLQRADRTLVKLPRNIGIGSAKEDVDKAYADIEKEVSEKYESLFYTFKQDKYQIVISIDTTINRVVSISLSLTKF